MYQSPTMTSSQARETIDRLSEQTASLRRYGVATDAWIADYNDALIAFVPPDKIWTVGDPVTARANTIKVRAGSRGTVVGFSGVGGHPLVDFAGSGLVLIRAEHLERDDDATTEARSPGRPRSSGTTRLSATPRPPAVAAAPPPPPPDWFDRPPDAHGSMMPRSRSH